MLKEAGIPSYPALVRSGTRAPKVEPDFPSPRFDHVILFVPMTQDTVWLEATSRHASFGFLGTFTEDRHALVTTPEGGILLRTPKSRPQDNRQIRVANVTVEQTGHAHAIVETRYTGQQADHVRSALGPASGRQRETWINQSIGIPAFKLLRFDTSKLESPHEEAAIQVELDLPRFAVRTGSRLFVPLNLMERWSVVPPALERRTQPVELAYAYVDSDSIIYRLPTGFVIETIPELVHIETEFGTYRFSVEARQDGSMICRRTLVMYRLEYPPDDYEPFRAFVLQVVQADRAQAVLVRR